VTDVNELQRMGSMALFLAMQSIASATTSRSDATRSSHTAEAWSSHLTHVAGSGEFHTVVGCQDRPRLLTLTTVAVP